MPSKMTEYRLAIARDEVVKATEEVARLEGVAALEDAAIEGATEKSLALAVAMHDRLCDRPHDDAGCLFDKFRRPDVAAMEWTQPDCKKWLDFSQISIIEAKDAGFTVKEE